MKSCFSSVRWCWYISNPIVSGNFVTPSKMEAMAYTRNGKVYEKSVNINEVAWIDSLQGQYIQSKSLHPFETVKYNINVIDKNSLNIIKKQEFIKTLKGEEKDLARINLEKELNITPIKEFGKNYAEFYHNPNGTINKLLAEKQGQVAGAFYRKDLGDIDLVWCDIKIGLRKILDKHIDDFSEFGNDINAVGKALNEIISKGELKTNAGVHTLVSSENGNIYRVGLSKGWLDRG